MLRDLDWTDRCHDDGSSEHDRTMNYSTFLHSMIIATTVRFSLFFSNVLITVKMLTTKNLTYHPFGFPIASRIK